MTTTDTDDLLALDLESKLTVAYRIGCECAAYFIRRRVALLPHVLREARRVDVDPVDLFARYARAVHARHEAGLSLKADAA